jgi:hypothetical protein
MRIRVIDSIDEIAKLDPRERVVHLVAPPTALTLLELIKRCPHLEAVQVPPSKFHKVSKPSRGLLDVQGVKIFPGLVWGHRTDRYAYYTVDDGLILQRAKEIQAEGLDSKEIV